MPTTYCKGFGFESHPRPRCTLPIKEVIIGYVLVVYRRQRLFSPLLLIKCIKIFKILTSTLFRSELYQPTKLGIKRLTACPHH